MAKIYYVTPAGIAKYPHLETPDTFKGQTKYKTTVVISAEDAKGFNAKLEDFIAANSFKTKKPKNPLKKVEDSDEYEFQAKSDYKPLIVDSRNKKLPKGTHVGGGSKIRLLVEFYPYDEGVSLRLKQVQVIELGGGAAFDEVEDGFEADDEYEASEASSESEDALDI